ncbi:MAG: alpha/beta hydrolase [Candidatus Paceibacterota bacterium]|jgi:hypothetical protein
MKRQVIVIHGGDVYDSYEAYISSLKKTELDFERLKNKKSWKTSLAQKLGDGFEVVLPEMPNDMNAKYLEWKIWFDKVVPFIEDGAVLVGHSLGGIFLAKYLSENRVPREIRATFLIAAPFDDEDTPEASDESLGDFALPPSLDGFARQGGDIYIYQSEDDPVVSSADMAKYARALPEAKQRVFKGRGHFIDPELPELVADIRVL